MFPTPRWQEDASQWYYPKYIAAKWNYCWRYAETFPIPGLSNSDIMSTGAHQSYFRIRRVIMPPKQTYAQVDKCGYDLWNILLEALLESQHYREHQRCRTMELLPDFKEQ